jgi:Pumilio-family RNA binding repeat
MQTSNNAVGPTYVTPLEPMNYRRLLDKTVSCDWKYIVDKIVCSNDQQASIFLQQKLKVGTAEQKYEIVEAIVNQAYPLMINRFGNFLVQRCFEHGTPEQVIAIANAIHGNVLNLSMDAFGCHVVQKAFDSVPENHKADMVRELLRRIPDTVIHRYACHVWQKLFELRWSDEPPQIMLKVNEALRGMWHEVALGETGSLVVQNIFENCVEEEKVSDHFSISREENNADTLAFSALPSKRSSQASILLLMVNLATGVSSICANMAPHLTSAASSTIFSKTLTTIASTNSLPRLWRNVSRLVVRNSWNVTWGLSPLPTLTVLAFLLSTVRMFTRMS